MLTTGNRAHDGPDATSPRHARELPAQPGLGRLLDLAEAPPDTPAPLAATPAERWRARAGAALEAGSRWFTAVVPLGDGEPGDSPGAVLTAVEDAGWQVHQVDHVGTPGGVLVCATFAARRPVQALGWPEQLRQV